MTTLARLHLFCWFFTTFAKFPVADTNSSHCIWLEFHKCAVLLEKKNFAIFVSKLSETIQLDLQPI